MDSKIPNARWFRVIVPIMIACIISFMDRVNISFALPVAWKVIWLLPVKWPV